MAVPHLRLQQHQRRARIGEWSSIQTYRLKINYIAFVATFDDVKRVTKEDWMETAWGILSRQQKQVRPEGPPPIVLPVTVVLPNKEGFSDYLLKAISKKQEVHDVQESIQLDMTIVQDEEICVDNFNL
eukprot:scaffold4007_cov49-Cyclotella_meneghiniana.AAC.1